MKKILLFTLEYPPFFGGVANYYGNLVKHWEEPNNIFVLNNNDGRIINKKLPFLKWLLAGRELKKSIRKNNIEHILVGHILPLGTVAYLSKTPYSVILHGMDFALAIKSFRKKWLAKKILKKAVKIICTNSYVAKLVKELIGENDKIEIVNPGVSSREKHNKKIIAKLKEENNLSHEVILFSVGRLVKRKGFDKVIESLPQVLKEAPNIVYYIAGVGPDEEYLKHTKELNSIVGAENKVIFLGEISEEEKWKWLEMSDIFIMPSRNIDGDFEGFGIVYLEANLVGTPVIAGDSGGVRDAVENNVNGLLVNPKSIGAIKHAIIELVTNKDLREKLGEQGRERVIRDFSWEGQIDKIVKLLK